MLPSEPASPQVTILTPTWNRCNLLPRLYQSLVTQETPPGSFEWLIVDDGSTDGTSGWLESLIHGAPFPIRVIQQENGGKHRALNRAAGELRSPWFLVLDSDDWLLPNAVIHIINDIAAAGPDVRAIIAPLEIKGLPQQAFQIEKFTVTFSEWMHKKKTVGDTSYIIREHLLKDFPFPEFPGEKFMAEGYFYATSFSGGVISLTNIRIVGAEYQCDGLSANSLHLRTINSLGALANYRAELDAGISGTLRFRSHVNYHRFLWHAKKSQKMPDKYGFRSSKIWVLPGLLAYAVDILRLKKDRKI